MKQTQNASMCVLMLFVRFL